MNRFRLLALATLVSLAPIPFATTTANAAPAKPKVTAKQMEEYERTTREVFQKLVAAMKPLPDVNWDKLELKIVDFCDFGNGPCDNAYSQMVRVEGGYYPVVVISRGYIAAFEGDADGIALVLGHELGHHFHGHCAPHEGKYKTKTKENIDGHRREADADNFGAKLLLQVDYSLRNAIRAKYKAMDNLNFHYSAVEGSWEDHPGTLDRLARLSKLLDDEGEESLWLNMAAFENGVYFLTVEDYNAAEACFLRVTKEFPKCAEAWANLGMARLMKYCDTLSADDLRKLDIGQFVAGVRFRYAKLMRDGPSAKLSKWKEAEAALQTALALNPKSTTVLVGLGLAYLVCPERTDKRMKQAEDYLNKAFELVNANESDLEPEALAALLINRGVVRLANGETDDGRGLMLKAKTLSKDFAAADKDEVHQAVMFNTAMALRADGKTAQASETLKNYLLNVPCSNPWWNVAYGTYLELQKALGVQPQNKEELAVKANPLRKQMAVQLANGEFIHIGEALKDVLVKLGKPTKEVTDSSSGLQCLHYPDLGVVLIADDEEVFGFTINSDKGPKIVVKEKGPNGKVLGEIRIGMSQKEVEELSGVNDWINRCFTNIGRKYPYSPGLGIALIYGKGDKKDTVVGILLGAIPATGKEGDEIIKK
jgi:tetratricopeptide (TPR) repeat protein